MIPIYLCDDEAAVRREIRKELEKEILISGYDMKIICDSGSPEEVLDAAAKNGKQLLKIALKKNRERTGNILRLNSWIQSGIFRLTKLFTLKPAEKATALFCTD